MPVKSRMHKLILSLLLLMSGGWLLSENVLAQQTQDSQGSLLPEIDPQDIEIRSQYSARFPGLRRQPILGFRPGSRVFQTDPDRIPFLEDLEEIAAQLPVGELSRPDAPQHRFYPYSQPQNLYASLGY